MSVACRSLQTKAPVLHSQEQNFLKATTRNFNSLTHDCLMQSCLNKSCLTQSCLNKCQHYRTCKPASIFPANLKVKQSTRLWKGAYLNDAEVGYKTGQLLRDWLWKGSTCWLASFKTDMLKACQTTELLKKNWPNKVWLLTVNLRLSLCCLLLGDDNNLQDRYACLSAELYSVQLTI